MTHAERPLVSVVIPTRNRPHAVGDAIQSVLNQECRGTLFELEVIVVDDASSDDRTAAAVRAYPTVRYLRHDVSRGPAVARNTGIAASRGTFLAFLDDDDIWLPGWMSNLLPVLLAAPDVAVAYGRCIWEFNGTRTMPDRSLQPSGDIFEALLRKNVVGNTVAVLSRRAAVLSVGAFDQQLQGCQDYDLWVRLAVSHRFQFVEAAGPLGVYRSSSTGKWVQEIGTGQHAAHCRHIVRRALALRPLPPHVRDDLLDNVELNVMRALSLVPTSPSQYVDRWVDTLKGRPRVARDSFARRDLAWNARIHVLASAVPRAEAGSIAARARTACGSSIHARGLIAQMWLEIAMGALSSRRASLCVLALARAGMTDPPHLVAHLTSRLCRRFRSAPEKLRTSGLSGSQPTSS